MFYLSDGKLYIREDEGFRNISVTGKNKVVVTKELEGYTVIPSDTVVEDIKNPARVTIEEIIAQFHLTEENPIIGVGETAASLKKKMAKIEKGVAED